jgi:hypothetical protein
MTSTEQPIAPLATGPAEAVTPPAAPPPPADVHPGSEQGDVERLNKIIKVGRDCAGGLCA